MANKDIDLDDVGFDDEDFDFDFEMTPPKDDRSPVKKIASGAVTGFKSTLKSPKFIKNTLLKTLPPGYAKAEVLAQDVGGEISDLYDTAAKELEPVRKLGVKATKAAMGKLKGKLPKKIEEKLQKIIDNDEASKNSFQVDQDESNIALELGEIFKTQMEQDQSLAEQEAVSERLKTGINFKQHKESLNESAAIRQGIDKLVGYQDSINFKYQKKSLEIQFKQYFIQRDTLELAKTNSQASMELLTSIMKNTALPEHVKINTSEIAKGMLKERSLKAMGGMASDFAPNYIKEFGANIKQKMKFELSALASMASGVDTIDAEFLQEAGIDPYSELGQSLIGTSLAETAGNKIAKKFKGALPFQDKIDKLGSSASVFVNELPQKADEWARSRTKREGFLGGAEDFLKALAPKFSMRTQLENDQMSNIDEATAFDGQTRKSIVEIIPGYLARILQSIDIMRTNDPTTDLMSYDLDSNRFTTRSQVKKNIVKKMFSDSNIQRADTDANEILEHLSTAAEIPEEAKSLLKSQMLFDAQNNNRVAIDRYMDPENYASFIDDTTKAILSDYFKKLNEIPDAGGVFKEKLSTKAIGLKYSMPNTRSMAQDYINAGYSDILEETGVTNKAGNQESLNFINVLKAYREGSDSLLGMDRYNATPNADYGNGGPSGGPNNKDKRRKPRRGKEQPIQDLANRGPLPPNDCCDKIKEAIDGLSERLAPKSKGGDIEPGMIIGEDTTKTALDEIKEIMIKAIADSSKLDEDRNIKLDELILRMEGMGVDGKNTGPGSKSFKLRAKALSAKLGGQQGSMYSKASNFGKAYIETIGKGYGMLGTALSKAIPKFNLKKDKVKESAKKTFFDIKTRFADVPAITAEGLRNGEYKDKITNKVLTCIEDIKGEVVNKKGETVLFLRDFKEGLVNQHGEKIKGLIDQAKASKLAEKTKGINKETIKSFFKTNFTKENAKKTIVDLKNKATSRIHLTAEGIRSGEYRDKVTGKVITCIEDIKGEVLNSKGEIVLRMDDFKNGFMDQHGEKIKGFLDKAKDPVFLATFMDTQKEAAKVKFKNPLNFINKKIEKVKNSDIYLAGEKKARLTAAKLKAGGYYDAVTGKMLTTFDDIKNGVKDIHGKWVVQPDELEGGALDGDGNIALKPFKWIGSAVVGAMKFNAGILKGGGDVLKSWGSKLKGKLTAADKTVGILTEIKELLKDRMADGTEDRAGSAQGIIASRKAKRDAGKEKDKEKLSKLDKLMGKGKSKEDKDSGPGLLGTLGSLGGAVTGLATMVGGLFKLPFKAISGIMSMGGAILSSSAMATAVSGVGAVAGAVGSGLMAVGGAAVSALGALTLPVLLGAAAVVAVAYGGYKLYKYLKQKNAYLNKIRMAQYGFPIDDEDKLTKLGDLESIVQPLVKSSPNGLSFGLTKASTEEILKLFEIDIQDRKRATAFGKWFGQRFQPVFLAHYKAAKQYGSTPEVLEADSKVPLKYKLDYIKMVSFPETQGSPYLCVTNPFDGEDTLPAGEPKTIIAEATEYYKKEMEKEGVTSGGPSATGAQGKKEKKTSLLDKALAFTPVGMFKKGFDMLADTSWGKELSKLIPSGNTIMKNIFKYSTVGLIDAAMGGGMADALFTQYGDKLDPMTAARLKAYGLEDMHDKDKCEAILKLEKLIFFKVRVNKLGGATVNLLESEVFPVHGPNFGLDTENVDDRVTFNLWFKSRFLPVAMKYSGLVKLSQPQIYVSQSDKALKPSEKIAIIKELKTVKMEEKSDKLVWDVTISPFPDIDESNTDSSSMDVDIKKLETMTTEAEAAAKTAATTGKPNTQEKKDQGLFGSMKDKAKELLEQAKNKTKELYDKAVGATSGAMDKAAATYRSTIEGVSRGGEAAANAASGAYQGAVDATSNAMSAVGDAIRHPGGGTGGDINALPAAKGPDGQWSTYKDIIVGASKMIGVDPGLMATMAKIESGFRGQVKADTSSATGLYQFIKSTWNSMLSKYGAKFGIAPNTPASDPRANAILGGLFLKDNIDGLKSIGRPITDTDAYIAHFMGLGGARTFLKAVRDNPGGNAVQAMPAAASANKSIFYNNTGKGAKGPVTPRSNTEVYNEIDGRVKRNRGPHTDEARALAGMPSPPPAPPPTADAAGPTPGTVDATTSTTDAAGPTPPASIAAAPAPVPVPAGGPTAPVAIAAPTQQTGGPSTTTIVEGSTNGILNKDWLLQQGSKTDSNVTSYWDDPNKSVTPSGPPVVAKPVVSKVPEMLAPVNAQPKNAVAGLMGFNPFDFSGMPKAPTTPAAATATVTNMAKAAANADIEALTAQAQSQYQSVSMDAQRKVSDDYIGGGISNMSGVLTEQLEVQKSIDNNIRLLVEHLQKAPPASSSGNLQTASADDKTKPNEGGRFVNGKTAKGPISVKRTNV